MIIHCIGNSHVNIFKGIDEIFGDDMLPLFKTFDTGPTIAYNFYQHHYYPKAIKYIVDNVNVKDDYIMLIIGEVDCRWHIPKQAELQNRNITDVVIECVDRYFKCFLDLKNKGYKVIGWGGHPSTTAGHNDDIHAPVYGECVLRNKTSLLWNSYLEEKCKQHDVPFISIIHELIDKDTGLTKMDYFIDYCHLKSSLVMPMVMEKLSRVVNLLL